VLGFKYALVKGEGSDDNRSFEVVGDELRTLERFDFEKKATYNVRLLVDNYGLTHQQAFVITVNDLEEKPLNQAPSDIQLSNNTIKENSVAGTTVGTLRATDADANDTVKFSLESGDGGQDNSRFTLDGATLKANGTFDYETKASYSLRVRATDSAGATYDKVLAVSVTDVAEFKDMTDDAWYAPAVQFMAERNYVRGDGDGNLRPLAKLTRADFTQIVMTALGIQGDATKPMTFKDMANENAWYHEAMKKAWSVGVIRGYTDGTLRPDQVITRQEAMVILHRALMLKKFAFTATAPGLETMKDSKDVNGYAKSIVDTMLRAGIANGSNGMLRPQDVSLRAEGFALVYRAIQISRGDKSP
jgi:hypothetical protein